MEKGMSSICSIREIQESLVLLVNHLVGILLQHQILYTTRILEQLFQEERMRSRISLFLREVFLRERESTISFTRDTIVIIRNLGKPLKY